MAVLSTCRSFPLPWPALQSPLGEGEWRERAGGTGERKERGEERERTATWPNSLHFQTNLPATLLFWYFHSLSSLCVHELAWPEISFFSYAAPSVWNSLSCKVVTVKYTHIFQIISESHLFKLPYWRCACVCVCVWGGGGYQYPVSVTVCVRACVRAWVRVCVSGVYVRASLFSLF